MLRRATGAQLDEALDGSSRARSRARSPSRRAMAEPPPPMKWWGWGDPPSAGRAAAARARLPAGRARRAGRATPRRSRSTPCELPEPRGPAQGGAERSRWRSGRDWVRDDRLTRVQHAAGKGYPDLMRMRARRREQPRRTPSSIRPTRQQVRAVLDACASRRRRRRAVRRRHERRRRRRADPGRLRRRWSRSTSARMAQLERRRRALADGGASGPACAARRSRRRSARWGLTLGHFPAVVRVRDGRRLGGDALGRPGLDRLRQDRGDGASACAA